MKKVVAISLTPIANSSNIPTPVEIETVLNFARRYPSGDNSQPFSLIQTSINEFEVKYFEARGNHYLNTDNIPSQITLGFMIESLSLGASQNNCKFYMPKIKILKLMGLIG